MNPTATPEATSTTDSWDDITITRRPQIDGRGVRFGAATVLAISATALLTVQSLPALACTLTLTQFALFIVGAWRGPHATPAAAIFRRVIAPRLRSVPQPEDAAPPRFAQAVGTLCIGLAVVGLVLGSNVLAFTGLALTVAASTLNAVFGLCLGCELYVA